MLGTKKCSQRYEIDCFCQVFLSAIQPSEITPEVPLEISFEIHLEILHKTFPELPLEIQFAIYYDYEIYSPGIGVCNNVCNSVCDNL